MTFGRIRTDDHDHVRLLHGRELLRAGRFTQRVLEAVAGRRMTDSRAGVDVVVAKAARTSFCTRKVSSFVQREEVMPPTEYRPYFACMPLELRRRVRDRFVPGHLAPGLVMLARIIGVRMRSGWVA